MIFRIPTWYIISVLHPIPFRRTGARLRDLQCFTTVRYSECGDDAGSPESTFSMIPLIRAAEDDWTVIKASVLQRGN